MLSLLIRTVLSLDGRSTDSVRGQQLEQDVLANTSKERGDVGTSEYMGQKYPKPESPQIYPPKQTMRGPAKLESDQGERYPTLSRMPPEIHPGGVKKGMTTMRQDCWG